MEQLDLTGADFGYFKVVKYVGRYKKNWAKVYARFWSCKCVCGAYFILSTSDTRKQKSCGCMKKELVSKANMKYNVVANKIPEYQTWISIKRRCYSENHIKYKNYGARGIKVCQEWKDSFESFLNDMGAKPTSKHSIDRIDVNGNYEPGNCRWATISEQANNKTTTRLIEFEGVKYSMRNLAIKLNCKYTRLQTLYVRQGRSMNEIIENNLLHL